MTLDVGNLPVTQPKVPFLGRLSRRVDRMGERRFALLLFVPAAILVGVVVFPPIVAVFVMSLWRINLLEDLPSHFIGLHNIGLMLNDPFFRSSILRTDIVRDRFDGAHGAARPRHGVAHEPPITLRSPNRSNRDIALGYRTHRHWLLLALYLPTDLRNCHRHRGRSRPGAWTSSVATITWSGFDYRHLRHGMALRAPAGSYPVGCSPRPSPKRCTGQPGWTARRRGRRSGPSPCPPSGQRC